MNIFKILASGDGSINEPNVSAFLGYLLNPKADHGIGDELLKKILFYLYVKNKDSSLKNFLVDKNDDVRNLSVQSKFEIEVLLEQAFKNDNANTKQIVDIVILCFEKVNPKKESLAKLVLSNGNRGELKQIFLVENKIRGEATKEGQLRDQCISTISTLTSLLEKSEEEIKQLLSLIFISPDFEKSNNEFDELCKDTSLPIPKIQLHWSKPEEDDVIDENTITYFLRHILIDEADGNIDAINEQTKFTIKSFIAFVDNNFRSIIEEELATEFSKEIYYDYFEFKNDNSSLFSLNAWKTIESFYKSINLKYPDLFQRHSPTHPVSLFVKEVKSEKVGKKIMSLTKRGKQIKIQLVYRNHYLSNTQKADLVNFLSSFTDIQIADTDKIFVLNFQDLADSDILRIFDKFYGLLSI